MLFLLMSIKFFDSVPIRFRTRGIIFLGELDVIALLYVLYLPGIHEKGGLGGTEGVLILVIGFLIVDLIWYGILSAIHPR